MKYMLIMNSPRDGYDQYMSWPRELLELLVPLQDDEHLRESHRLDAVRAHLLERTGDLDAAMQLYREAASKTTSLPERNYLLMKSARVARSYGPRMNTMNADDTVLMSSFLRRALPDHATAYPRSSAARVSPKPRPVEQNCRACAPPDRRRTMCDEPATPTRPLRLRFEDADNVDST